MTVEELIKKYEKVVRDYVGITSYKEFLDDLKQIEIIEHNQSVKNMDENAKTEYTKEQLEDHIWTLRRLWPKGPGNDKAKQAIIAAIRIMAEKKDDLSGQEQYR